jgi:hypothetical protein
LDGSDFPSGHGPGQSATHSGRRYGRCSKRSNHVHADLGTNLAKGLAGPLTRPPAFPETVFGIVFGEPGRRASLHPRPWRTPSFKIPQTLQSFVRVLFSKVCRPADPLIPPSRPSRRQWSRVARLTLCASRVTACAALICPGWPSWAKATRL